MKEYVLLAPYTTMRTGGPARYFFSVKSEEELTQAISYAKDHNLPFFVLGGGSNIVVSNEGFKGVVIRNEIKGITYEEMEGKVLVTAGAGEVWDDLVANVVERGLWGIENLSAIPGVVGATPVQNIGAYGVEVAEVVHSVRVYDTVENVVRSFTRTECEFGYRTSIFKKSFRRFVVTHVTYALATKGVARTDYHDLNIFFSDTAARTSREVRAAVCQIRATKLPDPITVPNSGSFFKNPVVTQELYKTIQQAHPQVIGRSVEQGVKLSAAHLIELCGWKGTRCGDVGVSLKHALVVVNYGRASGNEIVAFAESIARDVKNKIGVRLEYEVEVV
ncbi:MAG: UDP-N-acetylmuramate dehydrogenase [Minisyncoccota bacterium]